MAEKAKQPKKPTERTVLVAVEVSRGAIPELPEVVRQRLQETQPGDTVTVYLPVGEATGSKSKAVEAVVGESEGTFRAPSTSSWRGAIDQGEETIPETKKFRRRRVD